MLEHSVKINLKPLGLQIELNQKSQKLQFLQLPHEAKSKTIPIVVRNKMTNFTAEINMFQPRTKHIYVSIYVLAHSYQQTKTSMKDFHVM